MFVKGKKDATKYVKKDPDQELDDFDAELDQAELAVEQEASRTKIKTPRQAPYTPAKAGMADQRQRRGQDYSASHYKGKVSQYTADVTGTFAELQDLTRIIFLHQMHLPSDERESYIRQIWGDSIRPSDWEWIQSKNQLGWNGSNWKRRAIKNMKVRTPIPVTTQYISLIII